MSEETKKEETKKEIKEGSEQIKSEAKSTFNDAKESIKNVNFKNDAKVTSGYVTGLFKKPLETIKEVANDAKNTKFKNALILLIVWLVVVFILSVKSAFSYTSWSLFGKDLLTVIKDLLAPLLGLAAISGTIFFMQKGAKKKSLTTIITTITTAISPIICANIITLLTLISSEVTKITSPINKFAIILSAVFTFFGAKALLNEEDDTKAMKKFIVIEAIYFAIYFALTFLGIYIPAL